VVNRYKYLDEKGSHLHTLDGKPLIGTSNVVNVIAKPLAWYGSGKAVEVFGCPDPRVLTKIKNKKASKEEIESLDVALCDFLSEIKEMDLIEFRALIDKAYRAHDTYKRERAATGTDTHADCEAFIKFRMQVPYIKVGRQFSDQVFPKEIQPFIEWSDANVKRWLWAEGHCYSEKYWLGGISDAGYENNDGMLGILDIKSSREAYVSQFWQCAGYDIQISENGVMDKDGNMLVSSPKIVTGISEYCIFAFGGDKPRPYFFSDPAGAQEAFLAALTIYRKLPQE
jgi:hypothetical protein